MRVGAEARKRVVAWLFALLGDLINKVTGTFPILLPGSELEHLHFRSHREIQFRKDFIPGSAHV